jgi:CheY-like chemotaxis protein
MPGSSVLSARARPRITWRILVVEDDVLVRAAASHYLRNCGFTVVEAVDVAEALQILTTDRLVRAVFADVRLPGGRDGLDLMNVIRTDCPEVKVLLTSGIAPFPELPPDVLLLRKPYYLFEVERQLVNLLAEETSGAQ